MTVYEIRVRGHLNGRWSDWFDGLKVTNLENGETLLSGNIADQAALHGVLIKVRDLGLPLMAVTSVGPDERAKKTRRRQARSCWSRAPKIRQSSPRWDRGRANKRSKRGERCPGIGSCSTSAKSCASRSIPTHAPWRPAAARDRSVGSPIR
jgi:hypothetical protein